MLLVALDLGKFSTYGGEGGVSVKPEGEVVREGDDWGIGEVLLESFKSLLAHC